MFNAKNIHLQEKGFKISAGKAFKSLILSSAIGLGSILTASAPISLYAQDAKNTQSVQKQDDKTQNVAETSLFDLYQKGGPAMHIILGVALLALGLTITQLVKILQTHQKDYENFVNKINMMTLADALKELQNNKTAVAEIIRIGIENRNESPEKIKGELAKKYNNIVANINKQSNRLAAGSVISTIFGSIGTGTGLYKAFSALATGTSSGISAGISEAIITTVFGGIVAGGIIILKLEASDNPIEGTFLKDIKNAMIDTFVYVVSNSNHNEAITNSEENNKRKK